MNERVCIEKLKIDKNLNVNVDRIEINDQNMSINNNKNNKNEIIDIKFYCFIKFRCFDFF